MIETIFTFEFEYLGVSIWRAPPASSVSKSWITRAKSVILSMVESILSHEGLDNLHGTGSGRTPWMPVGRLPTGDEDLR